MGIFEALFDGIQYIADWLTIDDGIYAFFEDLLKQLTAWYVVSKLKFMLWTLNFSWGVASQIMFNLGVGNYISQAFSGLDPVLMGYLNFFRVPESLNLIIQAFTTRVTLRVMGW